MHNLSTSVERTRDIVDARAGMTARQWTLFFQIFEIYQSDLVLQDQEKGSQHKSFVNQYPSRLGMGFNQVAFAIFCRQARLQVE